MTQIDSLKLILGLVIRIDLPKPKIEPVTLTDLLNPKLELVTQTSPRVRRRGRGKGEGKRLSGTLPSPLSFFPPPLRAAAEQFDITGRRLFCVVCLRQ